MKETNWLDEEVGFYDFIWREGLSAHEKCINKKLLDSAGQGEDVFNANFDGMKKLIFEKYPTREKAEKAYLKSQEH